MSATAATHRDPPKVPNHDLLKIIGRGSYGEIWLARSVTGVLRAVKLVERATFDSDKSFEREFEGMARFEPISREHTCFVDILHVGRDEEGGFFYYVMELADDHVTGSKIDPDSYVSKTLKTELARRGRLSAQECIALGISLCEGLAALHHEQLVHRDIKPANIIFVGGKPKIADIGLVAASGQNSFVGTEGYVPPEGPGSTQADIYSLGKVVYEMAMGKDRLDFPQLNTGLAELPDKRELLRLNEVLLQACASDPGQRYEHAEDMREDLVRIRSGKPLAARSRRRRMLVFILLMLAALAGGGIWFEHEQAARGSVVITTEPPGATVQIDDKSIHAPARFDRLREGKHEVTVTLPNYDDVTQTIEVFADEERTLPIVNLTRSTGGIELTGQPRGATFELRRGKDVIESRGFPATLTALPTGAYEVVARYDGEEKRVPVEVKRGEVIACAIEFRFGTVTANSNPPGAELTVDGKVAGIAPQTLTLLEGEHKITAAYRSWPPQTRTIKVDAAQPATEQFEFPYGSVKFTSFPTGAVIRYNDQDIGTTNEVISEVEPGEKIYELHLPGYQTLTLKVQVKPGEQAFAPGRFSSRIGPQRGQPWKNSLGMEFVPVGDILMCIWETRVQDYEAFCRATQRARPVPPYEESIDRPSEHPVVSVSWDDGHEFCEWLTEKELGEGGLVEGQLYRLPTDLEWSRAAGLPDEGGASPQDRDGKIHEFLWGKEWPPPREAGNFADLPVRKDGKPVIPGRLDGHIYTAPVGSFPANANGLFDMAGNVWEWCLEPYRPDSHWGVLRGGSWVTSKELELYASYRNVVDRSERDVIFGFRVVLVPDGTP